MKKVIITTIVASTISLTLSLSVYAEAPVTYNNNMILEQEIENSFQIKEENDKFYFETKLDTINVEAYEDNYSFLNSVTSYVPTTSQEIIGVLSTMPQIVPTVTSSQYQTSNLQNQQQGIHNNRQQSQSQLTVEQQKQQLRMQKALEQQSKVQQAFKDFQTQNSPEMKAQLNAQKTQDLKAQQDKLLAMLNNASTSSSTASSSFSTSAPASNGEIYMLAQAMNAEAGGEGEAGMLAVGVVIMNRVNSTRFPNTITGVVTAPRQFSSYGTFLWGMKKPSNYHLQLAQNVYTNYRTIGAQLGLSDAYYFMNRRDSDASNVTWFDTSLRFLKKIGQHEFFGYK